MSCIRLEGFVHRDLAARNIFVEHKQDGTYHAKLGDFGLARSLDGKDHVEHGNDIYERSLAAPENYAMPAVHSRKSDVYQFGKVCFERPYGALCLTVVCVS